MCIQYKITWSFEEIMQVYNRLYSSSYEIIHYLPHEHQHQLQEVDVS